MRSATFAIGIAGLLVLLFAMLVMYQLVANEEALNAPVPVDENADQQQGIFPDPPQAGTADEPAMPYPTTKPDQPTKPEKKAPLDER